MIRTLAVTLVLSGASSVTMGQYLQIAAFTPDIQGSTGAPNFLGATIDGTTAYNVISGTNVSTFHGLTKVTGLGGSKSNSVLVSQSAWDTANGGTPTSIGGGQVFDIGTQLQVADNVGTGTDSVYRINKSDGAITKYATAANFPAGASTINFLGSGVLSTGEAALYDNANKRILATTGANSGIELISKTEFETAFGASATINAFAVGASDVVFIGDNNGDRILRYNPADDSNAVVLTTANITTVTGGATAGFLTNAVYAAPDGRIYFYETVVDSIMSFDPSNPVATLTTVLDATALAAGPSNSTQVQNFAWYNGNIAWTQTIGSGGQVQGIYAIPEPATLGLIAMSGIGLLRRRRV